MLYQNRVTKHQYFGGSPYGWPGIVVGCTRSNYQQVCQKKMLNKIIKIIILISGKLSKNVYVLDTCFVSRDAVQSSISW